MLRSPAVTPAPQVYSPPRATVFTGSLPFDGDSPLAVVLKHVNEAPPLPQSKNPRIEPKIAVIIMKCMEKKPESRFASVADLYEFLAKVTAQAA